MSDAEHDAQQPYVERLTAERDAAVKALNDIRDPLLKSLRFENGELNMEVCGPMIQHFALMFGEYSRKLGAANYVTIGLNTGDGERFEVTFQKVGAKTATEVSEERRLLCDELSRALRSAITVAEEARLEWDAAPSGMRAGKLLVALAGHIKGYRPDIDAIHAALAKAVPLSSIA